MNDYEKQALYAVAKVLDMRIAWIRGFPYASAADSGGINPPCGATPMATPARLENLFEFASTECAARLEAEALLRELVDRWDHGWTAEIIGSIVERGRAFTGRKR
ncbi:MAG TPA: hypothetical protein VFE27_22300 [Acidobacteriaceae bacterium]|jgi:hypothetical protein|nr:hypothetical protein [Acidobacteriaceae bacterium]